MAPLAQFSAELVSFLAAVAGIAVVALRGRVLADAGAARALLGVGFGFLAAAAFVHGSGLDPDAASVLVLGLRSAGVVLTLAGTQRWRGSARSRTLLSAGLGLVAVAGGAAVAEQPELTAASLVGGGLLIGAALVGAARRSIAARVAVGAGATLLLLVLVVSTALSSVISSELESQALERVDSRAATEAQLVEREGERALEISTSVAQVLGSDAATRAEVVSAASGPPPARLVQQRLDELLRRSYAGTALAYLGRDNQLLASTGIDDWVALSGSPAVVESLVAGQPRQSVASVTGHAYALASYPLVLGEQGPEPVGAVLAVRLVDSGYLQQRVGEERDLSLTLRTVRATVASAGPQPPEAAAAELATTVLTDAVPDATVAGDRFVAIRAVRDPAGSPVLALLASSPTAIVSDARSDLFRTLFLVALGGAVLALLLAALVGDRISAGLRRLTRAAEGLQEGRFDVRVGRLSEDEVGTLGVAFDSMAASIQGSTEALRRAAEEEARLRDRLEAVVGGMGEALLAVDGDGRVTQVNRAAEDLVGRAGEDLVGLPLEEVVAGRLDDGESLPHRVAATESGAWYGMARVVDAEGDEVPVALSIGALAGAVGDKAGHVLVLRDLRREQEIERMKREFFSRVQHEMRTPLTAIKGYAHLLQRPNVAGDRARRFHEEILSNADRLLRIVQMVEFFAAVEAGRRVVTPQPTDVRAVVDQVVESWRSRVDGAHPIRSRIARSLPQVAADPTWLGIAVHELVDNAVKFSPDGGEVSVTVKRTEGGGAEIAVADHGIGIERAQIGEVFTAFHQGDPSDTRSFGGLGLGLAVVSRLAEELGGEVRCTSSPGRGSKFSIHLPPLPIVGADAPDDPDPAAARRRERRRARVGRVRS